MNVLIESLVFVSSGLLIPCVAFLFILLGDALNKVFLSLRTHNKQLSQLQLVSQWIRNNREPAAFPVAALPDEFSEYSAALLAADNQALAAHLLAEFEAISEKKQASLNRLARLGPMTGLLGTLIPMGPALDGLANGDIAQLAGQMQIAFTTTVIGLVIGGIGVILVQRQLQISRRQLAALDYLCDTTPPGSTA